MNMLTPGDRAFALLVMVCAAASPGLLDAQDACDRSWRSRAVEELGGTGSAVAIALDLADNVHIAAVVDGRLLFTVIAPSSMASTPLESAGRVSAPSLMPDQRGTTSILYHQVHAEGPEYGREVFLVEAVGGSISEPVNLSNNRVDDYGARLALDRRGEAHVVWAQAAAASSRILYRAAAMETALEVGAEGDVPALALDGDDGVHVAYLRRNDIVYVSVSPSGTLGSERAITDSPLTPESSISIGVLPDGTVLIAYESEGDLYLAVVRTPAGELLETRRVDSGGVLDPRLRVKNDGTVLLVYIARGDVNYVAGQGAALNELDLHEPLPITETAALERGPQLDVDRRGALHGTFLRSSVAYYTNNVCAPEVDFAAAPTSGPEPLTVQFRDLSVGAVDLWRWDFGDGRSSALEHPVHVYDRAGKYTVRLTVWGPGGVTDETEVPDLIVVDAPINSFRLPDRQVLAGASGVWFPVLATHADPISGFQVLGTFDPVFLTPVGADTTSTSLHTYGIAPAFAEIGLHEDFFEVGVLFELQPPFGDVLPPGEEHRLINLIFDVTESAPQGETTTIRLIEEHPQSRVRNMMAVDGQAVLPALRSAAVAVRPARPPFPRRFVRGDFNDDGVVNVSDAVSALAYLFQGGGQPACLDAADVTDRGRIELTSAIALLNFLFVAGPAPAVPYPDAGLDPTADELGECLLDG